MVFGDIDHYRTREKYFVTKIHKVVTIITGLREWTPSKMVNFHEQRAIVPECLVQYRLLSNFKTTLWYYMLSM